MIRILFILGATIFGSQVNAQTVVAAAAIRAKTIISADDIVVIAQNEIGAFSDPNDVIGLEARVNIYPGRPIRLSDLGAPAILERNQIVMMTYRIGVLVITAEGRILDRGGVGEYVRVMNMDSRTTVTGIVLPNGTIEVGS